MQNTKSVTIHQGRGCEVIGRNANGKIFFLKGALVAQAKVGEEWEGITVEPEGKNFGVITLTAKAAKQLYWTFHYGKECWEAFPSPKHSLLDDPVACEPAESDDRPAQVSPGALDERGCIVRSTVYFAPNGSTVELKATASVEELYGFGADSGGAPAPIPSWAVATAAVTHRWQVAAAVAAQLGYQLPNELIAPAQQFLSDAAVALNAMAQAERAELTDEDTAVREFLAGRLCLSRQSQPSFTLQIAGEALNLRSRRPPQMIDGRTVSKQVADRLLRGWQIRLGVTRIPSPVSDGSKVEPEIMFENELVRLKWSAVFGAWTTQAGYCGNNSCAGPIREWSVNHRGWVYRLVEAVTVDGRPLAEDASYALQSIPYGFEEISAEVLAEEAAQKEAEDRVLAAERELFRLSAWSGTDRSRELVCPACGVAYLVRSRVVAAARATGCSCGWAPVGGTPVSITRCAKLGNVTVLEESRLHARCTA